MANKKNLANGFIDGTLSAVATSVDLKAGYADDLPATPFDMVITPFGQMSTLANSEIVKVTNVSSNTLTIVRAMKGTTAKAFVDGDVVSNGVFVEDVVGLEVNCTTARTTAAKVGTTTDGNYEPVYGDKINVTFTLGISVANPTLNIDGSGAKNIRLATSNVSTSILNTTASTVTIPMWYDGTYWQLFGSYVADSNTTYSEISEANIINTTSSSTGLITGRRAEYLMANEASATRTLTNKTLTSPAISTPTGIVKGDVGLGNVDNTSVADILLAIYPVGAIYMSVDSTNPGTLFGGTWTAWGAGRVPVGYDSGDSDFNSSEKTGGAKTHTLTIAQMPSHNHTLYPSADSGSAGTPFTGITKGPAAGGSVTVGNRGGGEAHPIMQPYITCYMFKRTA